MSGMMVNLMLTSRVGASWNESVYMSTVSSGVGTDDATPIHIFIKRSLAAAQRKQSIFRG